MALTGMLRHFLVLGELSIELAADLVLEGFKLQDVILSTPVLVTPPAPTHTHAITTTTHTHTHTTHTHTQSIFHHPPPSHISLCLGDDLVIMAQSVYGRASAVQPPPDEGSHVDTTQADSPQSVG